MAEEKLQIYKDNPLVCSSQDYTNYLENFPFIHDTQMWILDISRWISHSSEGSLYTPKSLKLSDTIVNGKFPISFELFKLELNLGDFLKS